MAEEKYALSSDPSKISPYGASQEQLSEYQKSLEDQIGALEQRYREPNWFKVSAGFLKPQLGGFAASLGSASEAMGENVEKQRESQIPIAQMRAQLAQSNILLNSKSKAAEMAKQWEREHPGEPYSADLMAKIAGYDKELADRLGQGVKQNLEQRTLSQKEQAQAIELLSNQRQNLESLAKNGQIDPKVYKQRAMEIDQQLNALMKVGPFGNPTRAIPNSEALTPGATITTQPGANTQPGATSSGASSSSVNPQSSSTVSSTPPSKSKPEGMLPEVHPRPSVNFGAMNPVEQEQEKIKIAQSAENATRDEKNYQEQFQNLNRFSSAIGDSRSIENARNTIQRIALKDPQGFHKLTDAVREGGPFAAAIDRGVAFHAGSLSANISLPVEQFKIAGLDTSRRTDYDDLANAFAILASAGMHNEGVTPQSYVNHPGALNAAMRKYAGVGQTGPAAYKISMQNALKFEEMSELAKLIKHEHQNRTNKNSQARYTDAYNSPNVQKLHDIFSEKSAQIENAHANRPR